MSTRRFDEIPYAPGGEGWLGHNGEFRRDRMALLRLLANIPEPLVRLRLPFPGVRAVAVGTPELVQELLVEKARSFDKSAMLRFSLFPLAGEGLFTSNGELWRRQRRLMAPLFHPKVLETYAADMVACAQRTIDGWRDGAPLTLLHETTRLTMSVAGKTLFDADTFTNADEIGRALTVALDWSGHIVGRPFAVAHIQTKRRLDALRPHLPVGGALADRLSLALRGPAFLVGARGRELGRAIALLDNRVQRMIDDRRRSPGHSPDLLARLLAARDDEAGGAAMDDRQVRDEVLTLFVAGHETTATGLAWTIALLCKHPAIYAAVEREVDAVGDAPTVADLPRLGLTLRVFREALRLYPPVFVFGRDSREPVTLGGYELPTPTNVFTSPWALHHNPRYWPDPERFDPDRFLPEAEAARPRYAYLPFGAGPRVCIGRDFAYMEAQLALCVILRRWRFELLADDVPEPSATLRPKRGVPVRVHRRAADGSARVAVGAA
jgi:cytochrome P450